MANAAKRKGDNREREAVEVLLALAPDLVDVARPGRKLGAGRREDTGDLWVFSQVAIQVRGLRASDLSAAIRTSAVDSDVQAHNAAVPWALGMAPVHGALKRQVRWLASCLDWPVRLDEDEVAVFGSTALAVKHVRNETIGVPRRRRVARIDRSDASAIWLAPIEAWIAAYRTALRAEREEPTLALAAASWSAVRTGVISAGSDIPLCAVAVIPT